MEDDSQAIIEAKKLFEDKDIPSRLAAIKHNFKPLVQTLTDLQ